MAAFSERDSEAGRECLCIQLRVQSPRNVLWGTPRVWLLNPSGFAVIPRGGRIYETMFDLGSVDLVLLVVAGVQSARLVLTFGRVRP